MADTTRCDAEELVIQTITLTPENYGPRTTLGGGTVRDLMPWSGALDYVTDGQRFGVRYNDGFVDWLGGSLSGAFGDGAELAEEATP